MSSESLPITPAAFAEAIKELTLPSLYAKVAELRNSIAHLQRSNQELRTFIAESCESDADKRELESYITENEVVMESMNGRIQLCKAEVEGRGQRWIELDTGAERNPEHREESDVQNTPAAGANGTGTATPEENPERSRSGEDDGGEDGLYL
ncbi:hypothetical protein BJX61DRAFT_538540 [Aspergillus egyptiacus]|nr:hypothetical protein BJX61DRAFT_538540 [Aspergillus egyptiacus]